MCGICGTIGFQETGPVKMMNYAMVHRGPDNTSAWHDGTATLGHTRLSIIDISPSGNQPMSNEDGSLWIVFNGEIYNFKELKKELELKGHRFTSRTDTEVILHLYEEKKEECLKSLRGMFSLAIWDRREKKLFCARDRFGIKPFFYAMQGNKFIFSSELRAMLSAGFSKKEINMRSLGDYFTYGAVESPMTLISDIAQLLPAHYLVFKDGALTIKRYWELKTPSVPAPKSEKAYLADIREILEDVVKMRLVGDVPVGTFLSGGIDSSVITALMQRHSSYPVKTFSVIFKEKEYDERKFSRKIAKYLGTDHTEILLGEKEILAEIPAIFDAMDQPSIDGFNTFIISGAVKRSNIKVALSGLGGDEVFAGYSSFRILPAIAFVLKSLSIIPGSVRERWFELIKPLAKTKHALKTFFSILKCNGLEDLYFMKRMVFLPEEVRTIIPGGTPGGTKHFLREGENARLDPVNYLSLLEIRTYLQNMLLQDTDRMSMANSLEVRVPFLDHILVEKMFSIEGKMKLGVDYPKRLLVKATKDLMPQEIQKRQKMGFVFPFERWLKGELRYYCEEKFSKRYLQNIAFLDVKKAQSIWTDFLKGSRLYNYSSILSLLSFVNWYEKNITGR